MTNMVPQQLLVTIDGDNGIKRELNVTYHLEDDFPVVGGIVFDRVLEPDGTVANLTDDEWEKVWVKCDAHKSQQPQ